jgi:hypothetical protein
MTNEVLYHYTTAKGLLGILESNVLWAGDLSYMNDFSEFKYAENLIENELKKAIEISMPELLKESRYLVLTQPFSNARRLNIYSAYSFCFCQEGDQLSQWRGYAQKGTGYSLGFDAKQIQLTLKESKNPAHLGKIIYKPEEQKDQVAPFIRKYVDHICTITKSYPSIDIDQIKEIYTDFFTSAFAAVFFFKDPAFFEEKEWRTVSLKFSSELEEVHFRETQGTVVPYIELTVPALKPDNKNNRLPIVEIIQGPLVDPALGEKSLKLLLQKYGYGDVVIRRSRVPLRFWQK